jgi:hypothetical protein
MIVLVFLTDSDPARSMSDILPEVTLGWSALFFMISVFCTRIAMMRCEREDVAFMSVAETARVASARSMYFSMSTGSLKLTICQIDRYTDTQTQTHGNMI